MENNKKLKVGISIGDMNGIGSEIILKTFNDKRIFEFCIPIVYCSLSNLNYFKEHFNFDIKTKVCLAFSKKNVWCHSHSNLNFGS